ncbi:hypothetical protein VCHA40P242_10576 [Vibrio chagasii]|nr:hypothetical protein VCHA40P242_10576 [Vibrio chagasii]
MVVFIWQKCQIIQGRTWHIISLTKHLRVIRNACRFRFV